MVVNRLAKNQHSVSGTVFFPGLNLVKDDFYFKVLRGTSDFAAQIKTNLMETVVSPREFSEAEFGAEKVLENAMAAEREIKNQLEKALRFRPLSEKETASLISKQEATAAAAARLDTLLAEHQDTRKFEEIIVSLPEAEAVKVIGLSDKAQLAAIDELEKEGSKRKPIFEAIRARQEELTPLTWGGVTEGSRIL